jgi:hypothetical protein
MFRFHQPSADDRQALIEFPEQHESDQELCTTGMW